MGYWGCIMDHDNLCTSLYTKVLLLRAIERLVSLPFFQEAWKLADEHQKTMALQYIEEYRKDELVVWARQIIDKNSKIEDMSMRQLRTHARRLGIKQYSHKTKYTLLMELANIIKEQTIDELTQKYNEEIILRDTITAENNS